MPSRVMIFSRDQVRRLTGLTDEQLAHWNKAGFLSPRYVWCDHRGALQAAYSYRDVVRLRAIAELGKAALEYEQSNSRRPKRAV